MKIVIVGAAGLLGTCLNQELSSHHEVRAFSKTDLDITSPSDIDTMLNQFSPEVVINCAAYLNADRCEQNPELSYKVNCQGVKNLVKALEKRPQSPIFIHFSTDYVFNGKTGEYKETDLALPLSVYGLHKLLADEIIQSSPLEKYYILRVASILGGKENQPDFSKSIVKNLAKRGSLKVVQDIEISLSSTLFISEIVEKMLLKSVPYGIYNCVSKDKMTWYEVARQVVAQLGYPLNITPCLHTEYPSIANRPLKSSLNTNKLAQALSEELPSCEAILKKTVTAYADVYHKLYSSC